MSQRLPGGVASALVLAAALLAGCASDKPKPTPLEAVSPQLAVRLVWSAKLESLQFPMTITVRNGAFVVAGSDGTVAAFEAQSGRELWRGQAGNRLSAGVGSDGQRAAVITVDNELVVFDRGTRLWSTPLASRAATPPLVAGERVFAMGVDRVVHAFDAIDGRRLWTFQRAGETLTLAQPGVLAAYQDTLMAGQGAVLVGLDPTRGSVRWEIALTSPRGTNEVERINDLIGPLVRVGESLCGRAFQTAVGCISMDKRSVRWSRNTGGVQAVAADNDFVFAADSSDRISAWRAAGGDLAWANEKFLYRGLSAPLSTGYAVLFGDIEGQLHFLARDDGRQLLRLPTDGSQVLGPPAMSGNTVLVATRKGGLFAFRLE